MNESKNQDQISLESFKNAILIFFGFLFRSVEFIFRSVYRYRYFFLVCCLAGLLAGYLYTVSPEVDYKAEMVVVKNELPKPAYFEVINNLNRFISSGSHEQTAAALNMPVEDIRKVISVSYEDIETNPAQNNPENVFLESFKVIVRYNDPSIAVSLQKGILFYLNSMPFLSTLKTEQRRINTERLAFINKEQIILDSIKTKHFANLALPRTLSLNGSAVNPAELFTHSYMLEKEKGRLLEWLAAYDQGVQMLDGFKTTVNPPSLTRQKSMLLGLLTGAVIGLFISLMLSLRNLINKQSLI